MTISIFNCFECGERLPEKGDNDIHYFWCDQECHHQYDERVKKESAETSAWSDYMAGDGLHRPRTTSKVAEQRKKIEEAKSEKTRTRINKKRRRNLKKARKNNDLANAFEPSSTMEVRDQLTGTSLARIRRMPEGCSPPRRCGKCGLPGHNLRTCSKK